MSAGRFFNYELPVFRLCIVREDNRAPPDISIESPGDAFQFLEPLATAAEEFFLSLHLNAKNQVIGLHEVSHGTLSSSLVHPREVFKSAIVGNSHAILLCHNHPSGSSLKPSREDLETTMQLIRVGELVGIGVIDHLIVGAGSETQDACYSLRENHPELWQQT